MIALAYPPHAYRAGFVASNEGFVALVGAGATEAHESSIRSALTPSVCIWAKTFDCLDSSSVAPASK